MLSTVINQIFINTGNLISYKEFKKKANQSPAEEIYDSVFGTFNSCLSAFQSDSMTPATLLKFINKTHIKVDKDERINLKITVKIFLERLSCEDLSTAIDQVKDELGIKVIDSLILSLPPLSSEECISLDRIKPLWIELEKLINEAKVLTIGISDLDTADLAELYHWSQVKPSVNQVNLESCCVMPPEMTAFARDNDIQLLTHNDPKVLLSRDMLQKILEVALPSPEKWKIKWIVRYSVVVKSRGIIQNKGYLLHSFKDI